MSCIFEDGVEGSIGESGFNFMNEEGSKKNIAMKRLVARIILNEIRTIAKGMHMGMMRQCMAMVCEGQI
jgi:hypothetical protein